MNCKEIMIAFLYLNLCFIRLCLDKALHIGFFRPKYVHNMYKLTPCTVKLDENFMKKFIKEKVEKGEMQMEHLIKQW
jgi:hypothetical protein